jgi:transposase-like protein
MSETPDDVPELTPEELKARIKYEYEFGTMPVTSIGYAYGVKPDTIKKWAARSKPKWVRQGKEGYIPTTTEDGEPKTAEELAAAVEAERQIRVVQTHRRDIKKARVVVEDLLDRLKLYLDGKPIKGPFMGEKESPADIVKKCTDSLRFLVPLERTAFGITDGPSKKEGEQVDGVVMIPEKKDLEPVEGGQENV